MLFIFIIITIIHGIYIQTSNTSHALSRRVSKQLFILFEKSKSGNDVRFRTKMTDELRSVSYKLEDNLSPFKVSNLKEIRDGSC